MKLAVLAASVSRNAGGLFASVRQLCLELCGLGTEVTVLGLEDRHTAMDLGEWAPLRPATFRPYRPVSFGYAPEMFRALCGTGPEIAHSHGLWMYPSVAVSRWSRLAKAPYVISPRGMLDSWALRNSRWKKRVAGLCFENATLRRAACLHALSQSEAEAFRKLGFRAPICVIPNGVVVPERPVPRRPTWSRTLDDGAKVLLFLGRIHPKKGLKNLLRAWQCFERGSAQGRESWYLVIAGWDQSGHEEAMKRLARDLGLRQVRFAGPQFGDEKAASFGRAAAFVLPSYSEGLPMAVLEAWAYGLPVLMTPQCHLPVGFDRGAAVRIDPDSRSILEGLTTLLKASESDRCAMGQRARKLAQEEFAWPRVAADMNAVYGWILGGGTPPDCVLS